MEEYIKVVHTKQASGIIGSFRIDRRTEGNSSAQAVFTFFLQTRFIIHLRPSNLPCGHYFVNHVDRPSIWQHYLE